jgi:hypothetical protein
MFKSDKSFFLRGLQRHFAAAEEQAQVTLPAREKLWPSM